MVVMAGTIGAHGGDSLGIEAGAIRTWGMNREFMRTPGGWRRGRCERNAALSHSCIGNVACTIRLGGERRQLHAGGDLATWRLLIWDLSKANVLPRRKRASRVFDGDICLVGMTIGEGYSRHVLRRALTVVIRERVVRDRAWR